MKILLLTLGIVGGYALTAQNKFCGTSTPCSVQTKEFLVNPTFLVGTNPNAVQTEQYGAFSSAFVQENSFKYNLLFTSTEDIDCSDSVGLMYITSGDATPSGYVQMKQHTPKACNLNFTKHITPADLIPHSQLVVAFGEGVSSATSSVVMTVEEFIIPGSLPVHTWALEKHGQLSLRINLNIFLDGLPRVEETCNLETTNKYIELLPFGDISRPSCTWLAESVSNDGTNINVQWTIPQWNYWFCYQTYSWNAGTAVFAMRAAPSFNGCSYYDNHDFGMEISQGLVMGPYGPVFEYQMVLN